jgi:hypothetical protein
MSGVFRNIDRPPPHHTTSVYPSPPPPLVRGEDTRWVERGWAVNGGSIVRKTPETALYSIYCMYVLRGLSLHAYIVAATIPKCGSCGSLILDRFILRVVDQPWHAKCLMCAACRQPLRQPANQKQEKTTLEHNKDNAFCVVLRTLLQLISYHNEMATSFLSLTYSFLSLWGR